MRLLPAAHWLHMQQLYPKIEGETTYSESKDATTYSFAQGDKEKEVTEHFKQHLGLTVNRLSTFSWTCSGYSLEKMIL